MTDGEAPLGSYALGARLDVKRGIRIEVSNSVQDSFLKNQPEVP
ncbi:MAG: hypothetical protein ACRELZ_26290 [Candidatus Rokuibacteriota bacterium]